MEPDGERDGRSVAGDMEVSGGVEEVDGGAVVVGEFIGGRSESGIVLEEGKKVFFDEGFLFGLSIRKGI